MSGMSLRHAVLASLLDGEATGYELGKRMSVSVANYWHASRQQIYAELSRLHDDGLADVTDVIQTARPSKRVYAITATGIAELGRFTQQQSRAYAMKDELLIKIQAADVGDLDAVIADLESRYEESAARLATYERLVATYLKGRTEEQYLASARRIGPYLNLRRGYDFERENMNWFQWAGAALRARAAQRGESGVETAQLA